MLNEVSLQYATALYELTDSEEVKHLYLENLKTLSFVFNEEENLKFFLHPNILLSEKKDLLNSLLKTKVDDTFLSFVYVLLDNKRLASLPDITAAFQWLLDEEKKILDVHVYSAYPLTPDMKSNLITKLMKQYQRQIRLHDHVDSNAIGGIKIKVGQTIIDQSLQHQLLSLKENLLKG